jgi:N-acetylglucosamine kinase-like BadF-type ATPase
VTARPTAAVLAIDGGNSKTDVALVAADGTVLARSRGPRAVPEVSGMAEAVRIIAEIVRTAADSCGSAPEQGPIAQHTAAYLAGVDLPAEATLMHDALSAQGWSATTKVDNDTFAVFRAGTTKHWGVGVVVGAGVNAVGIGPDGRVARFLALGQFTGDFGGGNDLTKQVMYWASRAEDGRGGPTALAVAVCKHFGLPTVYDVAVAMHRCEITRDQRLELTRLLFRVATDTGDEAAVALLERQAHEVAVMARQLLRELDLLDTETAIVLGGGVLTSRDPLLTRLVTEAMAIEAPRGVITFNDVPAIAGAALLGFDYLEIARAAENRLRSQLRHA